MNSIFACMRSRCSGDNIRPEYVGNTSKNIYRGGKLGKPIPRIANLFSSKKPREELNQPDFIAKLHSATRRNDVKTIEKLVHQHPEWINCENVNKRTALYSAAINGKYRAFKSLLNSGATFYHRDTECDIIHAAIRGGNSKIIKRTFMEYQGNGKQRYITERAFLPLHYAAGHGNYQTFKQVESICDELKLDMQNMRYAGGGTLIHAAVIGKNNEIIKRSMKICNHNTSTKNLHRRSPLQLFLSKKPTNIRESIEELELSQKNFAGGRVKFNVKICTELIENLNKKTNISDYHYFNNFFNKTSDVESLDKWKNTLLHLAVQMENPYIVKKLLELDSKGKYQFDVNARNEDGKTAILFAAKLGNFDLFKMLLRNNADVAIADKKDNSVLHMAIKESGGHKIINKVLELKSQGKISIDIDAKNKYGMTPLRLAVLFGDMDAVEALISAGAKTNHVPEWQQFKNLLVDLGVPVSFEKMLAEKKSPPEMIAAISQLADLSIPSFDSSAKSVCKELGDLEFHCVEGEDRKTNQTIYIDAHGITPLPKNDLSVCENTLYFKSLDGCYGVMSQKEDLGCNNNDDNYWVKVSKNTASVLLDSPQEITREQMTGSNRPGYVADISLAAMERPPAFIRNYQKRKNILEFCIKYSENKIQSDGIIGRKELTELIRRKRELKKLESNIRDIPGHNIIKKALVKRRMLGQDGITIVRVKPQHLSSLGDVLKTVADQGLKADAIIVSACRTFSG